MASAIYNLTTTPYTGKTILIYTGSNFQAIATLVATSTRPTDCNLINGKVYAFGELIEIGDAAAVTTDVSPLPAQKISARRIQDDLYSVEALQYDGAGGNPAEIVEFMSPSQSSFIGGVLTVNGVVIAEDDFVCKHRIANVHGRKIGVVDLTNYTIET